MTLLIAYSLRHLLARRVTTCLTLMSLALVTLALLALLMAVDGLERALIDSGSNDNLLLLRKGATTEISSGITRAQALVVGTLPGIARDNAGHPLLASEMVVLINMPKQGATHPSNVVVRGTSPQAAALRPQIRLRNGRLWTPGTTEIVLGAEIATRFLTGGIGEQVVIGKRVWTVVGIMDAQGTAFDSEIWGDVDQLLALYGRDSYSSVTLRLSEPSGRETMETAVAADPRLQLLVKRERDYYREKSVTLATFIRVLGLTFTGIFSLGAVLAGTTALYGAVAARTREIGVLRALGFGPPRILAVFLTEAVAIGLSAGLIAILAGSALQAVTVSTMNFSTFSEVAFRLTLTPRTATIALLFAVAIALAGGLAPAVRAARMRVTAALTAPGR
ncbi:MAG: ABC transporter permease [Nitrospiraceae bacterium]